MPENPYKAPQAPLESAGAVSGVKYADYAEVPFYRRQWFFWVLYFTMMPVALLLLLFGDIYYRKKDKIVSFGIINRIVAGLVAVIFIQQVIANIIR
ncbi:MAG: hypothetical protein ACI822_001565 [Gammaproteobacteria bacterium]|jgi:hypothetical protein